MKYAVIKTGGKQYKVTEGQVIEVERVLGGAGSPITFNEVLLLAGENTPVIGTPMVNGAEVIGKILEDFKGEKIRVSKFKAKARYRRVTGHRQSLTRIQIESIGSAKNTSKPKESSTEISEVKVIEAAQSEVVAKKKASKKVVKG